MKNKFIKSTLILLIGGMITKIIGMFIRIMMSRLLTTSGIGTFMLIMPTFSLSIAIAQFGFPISISKLVAENKRNNKKLVFSVIPISILINLILMVFFLFSSKYIAINLLHNKDTYLALRSIGFVLPFVSISSILRGYFFGRNKMVPHVVSNIVEDIVRFIVLLFGIPYFLKYGIAITIMFVMLSNIISELTSSLVLFFFLPKSFSLKKIDFIPRKDYIYDVFSISIPHTISRVIGNVGFFFEPIILTFVLLKLGYSSEFITNEYGILNGYVMTLLFLPSFFSNAISQAIVPGISYMFSNRKYRETISRLKLGVLISLLIGLASTGIMYFFGNHLLLFLYKSTTGYNYLKFLCIPFILFYIESPLINAIYAMGFSKESMICTFYGVIIKLVLIIILCSFYGFWGYIYATSINVLFVTIYSILIIKKKTSSLLI